MKIILFFFTFFCFSIYVNGQAGQWIWMNGDNITNAPGNYGTKGVASPLNKPPGMYGVVKWVDRNGMFWIYGGGANTFGGADDFWKFDPYANEWTWMAGSAGNSSSAIYGAIGIPSPLNYPGSRGYGLCSWTDSMNNLWLYGGMGSGFYADLWKYNIATNEWTCMFDGTVASQNGNYGTKGVPSASNSPGSRYEAIAAWTDSLSNLWLFGGYHAGFLDDVWRYDISTNLWTWMAGSSVYNTIPHYGTAGISNINNTPGGRCALPNWKGKQGNFWIFGGNTNDTNNQQNAAADLWKFDMQTLEWAWISGSRISSFQGHYGAYCNDDSTLVPAGRYEDRTAAVDRCGNFYTYGGGTFSPGGGSIQQYGDLWRYQTAQYKWQLLSGSGNQNTSPHYSAIGVANITNQPGSRMGAVAWFDTLNTYWLFGGTNMTDWYNDIWKFELDSACASCVQLPTANFSVNDSTICSGECLNFINLSQYATSYQWFFSGGTPSGSTLTNPQGICYNSSGSYDVTLIATNGDGSDTMTLSNYITIYPPAQFSALTKNGDTLFSVPGYISYVWYYDTTLIAGANGSYFIATQNGNYSVVVTDSNGCMATAQMIDVVTKIDNALLSSTDFTAKYQDGYIYIELQSNESYPAWLQLTDAMGNEIHFEKIFLHVNKNEYSIPVSSISSGIYFCKIIERNKIRVKKVLIQ
jgi:PKD repeat protein